MMRQLLWIAAFVATAVAAQAGPDRIRCVVDPTFICKRTGCIEREVERLVRVDLKAGTLQDCKMESGKLDCKTIKTTIVERDFSIEGIIEAPGYVVRSFTFNRLDKNMIVTNSFSNIGWVESGFGTCGYE